jgi:hypothetical protein
MAMVVHVISIGTKIIGGKKVDHESSYDNSPSVGEEYVTPALGDTDTTREVLVFEIQGHLVHDL